MGLVWDLGICFLESVGEGDGEGVVVVLEKKAVIWRCGFTIGDLPLLCLRDGAIFSIFILFFAASREVGTEHRERAKQMRGIGKMKKEKGGEWRWFFT